MVWSCFVFFEDKVIMGLYKKNAVHVTNVKNKSQLRIKKVRNL